MSRWARLKILTYILVIETPQDRRGGVDHTWCLRGLVRKTGQDIGADESASTVGVGQRVGGPLRHC